MARSPFSPPSARATADDTATRGGPLPSKRRGQYSRWVLGEPQRRAPEAATPSEPASPPGPDPIEVAFEQARAQGFEQGLAAGQERGEAAYAERIAAAEHSLRELSSLHGVLSEIYRREMVEVALCAAESLVQRDLREHTSSLQTLIQQALAALGDADTLRLSVSADDAPRLSAWIEAHHPDLTVHVDSTREAGDFRLESEHGSVESLMHERLDRIRQIVLGELAVEPTA